MPLAMAETYMKSLTAARAASMTDDYAKIEIGKMLGIFVGRWSRLEVMVVEDVRDVSSQDKEYGGI